MFRKYATATVISAEIARPNAGLIKNAHRAEFNYTPRPGFLYVRSRMISSRCNDNHDEFPAEEIRKAWKTAVGKPVFVNHHNEDHKRMRGVIIDAVLHEDTLPDGRPDVWIEALHEIDAQRFPKLAQAIIEGRVNRTSMGTDVGYSICSACGNKATTPAEYCQHIPQMKGKILYRHTASGQREGHLIREICYKLGFFENSFLVEDPADPTAVVTGVDDRGLRATASLTKEAAPEGMRFRFTRAEHHPNRKHFLKATLPDEEGRHREVGYLMWEPHDGQVSMVQTDYDKRGQGIASALWHRAHEVAGQHGLTPPRHSDVQTPDGMEWAQKVDQQPIHAPGHGQQSLFEVPPEQGGTEVAGVPRPRHDDLFDHLLHDHAEWGRESVEQMRDSGSLESAHQRLHANPEMFPGRHFHIHGVKSSLPKVAEYDVPCERPGCGTHWGPHGAAGLLIHHDDPEDGQTRYLLQKRAPWVDHGGTWGIPGGALHEGESPEEGARREAEEEMGELPDGLVHHRTHSDDHGGWVYHTVRMRADEPFHPGEWDDESTGHGWFTRAEMRNMDLHPGFAQSLPEVLGEHRKESSLPSIEIEAARYDKHQHPGLMRDEGDIHMRNPHHRPSSLPSLAFRKGAPFAGYEDFDDCVDRNADAEDPEAYCGEIQKRTEGRRSSLPTLAYGETKAPQDVDTLRTESCPVCGEVDAFDGDRCQVCNFLQPPAMFTDPDTGVARQMELRKDEMGQQAQVGPDGQPIPGQEGMDLNDPTGQDPAMQGLPGQAEDGVADLFCPACGFSADTQAPMTNNDPSMPSGQQGLLAGDVCPNCGEATMLSPNDVGMLGGEVPQEIADDANANGVPDDQEGEMPVDEGDLDGDGVPDDVEEGELDEEADAEAEADAVEDEDEAPKGRKDNTRRAARRG